MNSSPIFRGVLGDCGWFSGANRSYRARNCWNSVQCVTGIIINIPLTTLPDFVISLVWQNEIICSSALFASRFETFQNDTLLAAEQCYVIIIIIIFEKFPCDSFQLNSKIGRLSTQITNFCNFFKRNFVLTMIVLFLFLLHLLFKYINFYIH